MHPYEMKVRMMERGHDQVIRLKGASLYDTVGRLERMGLIESVETSREGRRPERTVYALTDSGRGELASWLQDLLSEPVHEYPQFAAGLAFLGNLGDVNRVVAYLGRRIMALEGEIAREEALLRAARDQGVLELFLIEGEYAIAMQQAELAWVRRLIHELEQGTLWSDFEAMVARVADEQAREGPPMS